MNSQQASEHVCNWFAKVPFLDLHLLNVENDGITPVVGTGAKKRLLCSEALVKKTRQLGKQIMDDWQGDRRLQGISYLIYRRGVSREPLPLYVGIARSSKKDGTNYSCLWKTRGSRFCDSYKSNGHVDCLSRSLFEGTKGYTHWASELFRKTDDTSGLLVPMLQSPVYVHIDLWDSNAYRILPTIPDAPLYVEEMVRLWILKVAGYGPQVLNREGN
jgi:hypothetical protein